MSYIGNTNTTQGFIPAIDYFSGDGSTVAFTLSRPVASVAQVQANISNVPQNPSSAFSVSGNTITFTSAPPSGTNNIYVYYTSPITQVIAPSQGTVTSSSFGVITDFTTTGNTVLGDASTDTLNVGNGGLVKDASGNVGIGTSSPSQKLQVGGGIYISGSATLGSAMAGIFSFESPVTRYYIGDGTGYSWAFSKRASSTTTDLMTITDAGNVGIGTSSPATLLDVRTSGSNGVEASVANFLAGSTAGLRVYVTPSSSGSGSVARFYADSGGSFDTSSILAFDTRNSGTRAERMRIDSSGNLLVGKTSEGASVAGGQIRAIGQGAFTASADVPLVINRLTNDGTLVSLQQASVQEGDISVSGTTVSYNGGHLSRYAQTTTAKDESLVKGTVLSNLDAMNVYTDAEGNPVANEQLNKVKVSDVEGDTNVAGVFVNWAHDDAHDVDEINMAMTGDMIIRIAQGMTVARGDLLMSAGDGTAKPQGDDIVRSKTVAKVTSTHVTCTYADGSYCVPCVLMAC
jgi:hypothetical protein